MITKFSANNFLCFEHISAPLGPLTVLIGPNNSGKSCFLKALAKFVGNSESNLEIEVSERFRFNPENHVAMTADFSNGTSQTKMQIQKGNGRRQIKPPVEEETNPQVPAYTPANYFDLPRLKFSMQSKGIGAGIDVSNLLQNDAEQIAALVDYLLRKQRSSFDQFEQTLISVIPGLEAIDVETPTAETRRIDLTMDGFRMPASQASVGVRLMIFFATLAYLPEPPRTLLIEEPETGVHPKRLNDILNLLRGMSTGTHAKHPTQIVLSTHSPYLLDCVDLESDLVLVFERDANGHRVCSPMDREKLGKWTGEYMLGELWMAGEEQGLVGGVPNIE